jgi:hypothetical protein
MDAAIPSGPYKSWKEHRAARPLWPPWYKKCALAEDQPRDGTENRWSKCLFFLAKKNLYSIYQLCDCIVLIDWLIDWNKSSPLERQTFTKCSLAAWHSGHRVLLKNRRYRVRIPPGCKVLGLDTVLLSVWVWDEIINSLKKPNNITKLWVRQRAINLVRVNVLNKEFGCQRGTIVHRQIKIIGKVLFAGKTTGIVFILCCIVLFLYWCTCIHIMANRKQIVNNSKINMFLEWLHLFLLLYIQ